MTNKETAQPPGLEPARSPDGAAPSSAGARAPDVASNKTAGPKGARHSLQFYLLALVLAVMGPLLAFSTIMVVRSASFEREATRRFLANSSLGLSLDMDREVTALEAVVTTLAGSRRVDARDFEGLQQSLRRSVPLSGAWFEFCDRSGQELINTRLPSGLTAPRRIDREIVGRVFATGKLALSNLYRSELTGSPVISISAPVVRDGDVLFVLSLVVPVERFTQILREQHMPLEWIGALFDRNGVTIARTHQPEQFVGTPGRPDIVAALDEPRSTGFLQNFSRENIELFNAFVRSDLTGWGVVVGAPVSDLNAAFLYSITLTLAGGALLLALGCAVAYAVARRITRSVAALAASAAVVGSGKRPGAIATEISELHDVAVALADADAAVRLANSDLRHLNETLEQRVVTEIAERTKAQEALRQSQKMETIGHLTGGVAHDFNNLLQVIIGNLESLRRRAPNLTAMQAAEILRPADAALRGAERAAMLTRQLLAFARRQPLTPATLDLNKLVSGMSEILRRTLGERVAIETILAGGLWPCFSDANQLESALLNLAVNARDAMPEGGKLTVETANTYLDERYSEAHDEVAAGQYVMLAVSDTGIGMTPEVIAQAFDPFFTTKGPGHGTGLGLSQVYGFLKQSGGHTKIYSEPGAGTTIKLYLPRFSTGGSLEEVAAEPHPELTEIGELVLVVEDDEAVRQYSCDILRELGYRVIEAGDGPAAMRLLDEHPEVSLLFTDVGLPGGMNGRQVADAARQKRPKLKVLFTTGYARNAIVHHGRLDAGLELIVKPYTYPALAAKIRAVLGK